MRGNPRGPEDVARSRRRRGVLDDARRRVERSLMTTEASDELARAAEEVLMAADAAHIDPDRLAGLRSALAGYRRARGDEDAR